MERVAQLIAYLIDTPRAVRQSNIAPALLDSVVKRYHT